MATRLRYSYIKLGIESLGIDVRDPWFPIACLLIIMIGVWLGILGPLPSGVSDWMHHWQNLIAAVGAATVASVAAYVAFKNTEKTLKHNERLERHRRARKLASMRAMLPLALAKISEYAENSASALNKLVDQCQNGALPKHLPSLTFQQNCRTIPWSFLRTSSSIQMI